MKVGVCLDVSDKRSTVLCLHTDGGTHAEPAGWKRF